MATVTGMTAERMLAIEAASVISGEVDPGTGHLILTTHGGTEIDAGFVLGDALDASTTQKGIAELATLAETLAMVDATRVVTPAGLVDLMATKAAAAHTHAFADLTSVPSASTTAQGIVELATTAEVSALTDTVRAVTPGSMATLMGTKSDTSHTHAFSALTGTATNAQLANMAANTIKGNNTGSSAAPADLTVSQVQALLEPGWTAWSPTLKGNTTNPTIGGGSTLTGQYRIIGNLLDLDCQLTIGSGWSNGSGRYYLDLPASKVANNYRWVLGAGILISSVGTHYPGTVYSTSDGTAGARIYLAVAGNDPFGSTWSLGTGDMARWSLRGIRIN